MLHTFKTYNVRLYQTQFMLSCHHFIHQYTYFSLSLESNKIYNQPLVSLRLELRNSIYDQHNAHC